MESQLKVNTIVSLIALLMFLFLFITACKPQTERTDTTTVDTYNETTDIDEHYAICLKKWKDAVTEQNIKVSNIRIVKRGVAFASSTSAPVEVKDGKVIYLSNTGREISQEKIKDFLDLLKLYNLEFSADNTVQESTFELSAISISIEADGDGAYIVLNIFEDGHVECCFENGKENQVYYIANSQVDYDQFKVNKWR